MKFSKDFYKRLISLPNDFSVTYYRYVIANYAIYIPIVWVSDLCKVFILFPFSIWYCDIIILKSVRAFFKN